MAEIVDEVTRQEEDRKKRQNMAEIVEDTTNHENVLEYVDTEKPNDAEKRTYR